MLFIILWFLFLRQRNSRACGEGQQYADILALHLCLHTPPLFLRVLAVIVQQRAHGCEAGYTCVKGAARMDAHTCAPSLIQRVIARCAKLRPDLRSYDENRTLLYEALTSYGYECAKPDGAFYLFVKAPGGDAKAFSERAKKENLLVVPSDDFGVKGYFRLSYCVSNDMIRRSLPAFKKLIETK